MAPLLRVSGLSRRFGGLEALRDVSFSIEEGEIHGLIGPNGAGKSTLINMVGGQDPGGSGSILFRGDEILRRKPHHIAAAGICRVFQNPRLFAGLTVLETVMVGCHTWTRAGFAGAIVGTAAAEEREVAAVAGQLLDRFGLSRYAQDYPNNLPYGHQRTLEIARALAGRPKLLLLDEPAAGLNPDETWNLADQLKELVEEGITLLLVEHNVELVMELCDRITVLSFGRVISEGPPAHVRSDAEVIRVYLGDDAGASA